MEGDDDEDLDDELEGHHDDLESAEIPENYVDSDGEEEDDDQEGEEDDEYEDFDDDELGDIEDLE